MPFDDDDDAGGGLERGRLTEREIYGALTTDLEDIPSAGFSPCREQERESVRIPVYPALDSEETVCGFPIYR